MKRKKRKRNGISLRLLLIGAFAACAPFAASPQSSSDNVDTRLISTRSIEGRVLNTSGAVIAGSVVLLKDGKTLQIRSYIADKNGEYHFYGLSTDVNYTLRAENQGLTSKQKTVSVFDSHKKVKLDLKLSRTIKQPKR